LATSQSEPIKTFVQIESDSPFATSAAGLSTPPSLDYESPVGNYILSGVVSGSTVTGATIQLTYPNNNFTITNTDLTGYYLFDNLQSGTYTLTTSYRGYEQDVRAVQISGNTSLGFRLNLIWGNNVDTWGKLAGENYYT